MINFYQKLLGEYEIISLKEDWELYKLGSFKIFKLYILGIFIFFILYIYIPHYSEYTGYILGYLVVILLLKFGEYKGYNEALYDLESNNINKYV